MSHESRPISPTAFRQAIEDLPIGNLHGKAAELRNSIDHLKRSNNDLAEFMDDPDCKQAAEENLEVIKRMEDRIQMLKEEVERRGMRWAEGDDVKEGVLEPGEDVVVNGSGSQPVMNGTAATTSSTAARQNTSTVEAARPSGRLTDEQLQRLLAERMGEPDEAEGDEGVHL